MDLKEKRVLVFGTGKSGIGAAELLEDMGSIPVLYDGNEKTDPAEVKSRLKEGTKAEVFIGNLPEKEIDKLSLVVLSPGVPTDLPLVLHFKEKRTEDLGRGGAGLRFWKRRRVGHHGNQWKDYYHSPHRGDIKGPL